MLEVELAISVPGQWYVMTMQCPEFTVAGPCSPGYPGPVYYGHNTNRRAPGGFVLICDPDGGNRRVHSAGFRNPYDFAYDRDGELFTFDADMEYDIGGPWYRPTRVVNLVAGLGFLAMRRQETSWRPQGDAAPVGLE